MRGRRSVSVVDQQARNNPLYIYIHPHNPRGFICNFMPDTNYKISAPVLYGPCRLMLRGWWETTLYIFQTTTRRHIFMYLFGANYTHSKRLRRERESLLKKHFVQNDEVPFLRGGFVFPILADGTFCFPLWHHIVGDIHNKHATLGQYVIRATNALRWLDSVGKVQITRFSWSIVNRNPECVYPFQRSGNPRLVFLLEKGFSCWRNDKCWIFNQ